MKRGRAYILCNGCPESRMDSASAQKYFTENGWLITEDHKDADLILFNACSLTQESIDFSLKIIQKIQEEKKSSSQFIVWGCLSKTDPEILKKKYEGPMLSEKEFLSIHQIIGGNQPIEKIVSNYVLPVTGSINEFFRNDLHSSRSPFSKWQKYLESKINLCVPGDRSIYYIKVATGCLGTCAYCSIRKSRGTIKSKSIEEIIWEFKDGLNKGFKNFSLLGTDLGAYGRDIGYTLVDLLREIIKERGDFKIGLRNVNPYWLKKILDDMIPILKTERIWYLSSAAESGSNRILKQMKRKYTIEEFKECIRSIRRAYPNIVIRTQLMVGFPTETEQDFKETMRLLDDIVFDYVEVYKFSSRSGTPAENMKDQIPEDTLNRRFLRLNAKALLNRTPRKIIRILQYHISGF